jgi:O-antigen/teichoic acid export membrane protein
MMQPIQRIRSSSFFGVLVNFFNLSIFQGASLLLQFLAIPLIIRTYGMAVFGETVLATSFAVFLGGFTNYGTHQTAIKEVATSINNKPYLAALFYKVLFFRSYAALITLPAIMAMYCLYPSLPVWLWLSIVPLVLAEVFNPLYFLIGIQKIEWISWGNLLVKLISLVALWLLPLHSNIAASINIIMGVPVLCYYAVITIIIIKKEALHFSRPSKNALLQLAKENFYIMFNGIAVALQQSIFLFAVAGFVPPQTLGAYSVVDKLLGAVRQLVSSFSNALYPKAAQLYAASTLKWVVFKTQINKGYAIVFGLAAVVIYVAAPQIVWLLTGAIHTPQALQTIGFIQLFAAAPLVLALNANNVLTLLLQHKYAALFYISVFILVATALLSALLIFSGSSLVLGWYPFAIEMVCLGIYTYYIQQKVK